MDPRPGPEKELPMLKARTRPNARITCPACENSKYVIFRREPAGLGCIRNRCRCDTCDETFSFDEDKKGEIVIRS
ncbi:MAG: hypothetical protein ACYTHM_07780 [Planctomycetota bacterium]